MISFSGRIEWDDCIIRYRNGRVHLCRICGSGVPTTLLSFPEGNFRINENDSISVVVAQTAPIFREIIATHNNAWEEGVNHGTHEIRRQLNSILGNH